MNKCNSSSCSKLSAIIETFFSSVFHNAGWICSYSNGTTPVIAEDRQPAQLSRVPFGFLEVSMALMNGEMKSQIQALALLSTATMWQYQIQPLMSNHGINSTEVIYSLKSPVSVQAHQNLFSITYIHVIGCSTTHTHLYLYNWFTSVLIRK